MILNDQDETAELALNSIHQVLKNVGDELLSTTSWVNRELRNPLTTMGRAAMLSVSIPITLNVHCICHRALNASVNGVQLVENCAIFFNRNLLWSTLDGIDTAAISALTRSTLFPGPFLGPSTEFLG